MILKIIIQYILILKIIKINIIINLKNLLQMKIKRVIYLKIFINILVK